MSLHADKDTPVVAIVGRMNVGKSALFNRLIEEAKALTSPIAGTTRDRLEGECVWRGKIIRVFDTGGLDTTETNEIERNVIRQAEQAMKLADLILFVVDGKTGPLEDDLLLARKLRRARKPIVVVANKIERSSERRELPLYPWASLGLGDVYPTSALRGSGVGDLLDQIFVELEWIHRPPQPQKTVSAIRVAVIGKPNVGKSSLLNAIIDDERFITSPIAHTTREPNDTLVVIQNTSYVLIDTAGMRKNAKVKKAGGLEALAIERNKKAMKKSDVVALVLDISEPFGAQDKTLVGLLKNSASGVLFVVNKWDLIESKTTHTITKATELIRSTFSFLNWAPILFVSALKKQRVKEVFRLIDAIQHERTRVMDNETLERFLKQSLREHRPPRGTGKTPIKILGLTQTETAPPTFRLTIKARKENVLDQNYVHYLEHALRRSFGFQGTPLKIRIHFS